VTIFISILVSIFLARPVASLLDNWFGLADTFSGWFTGEGTIDTMARNNGFMLVVIFVAIFLFISIRLTLWLLRKKIKKLKERLPEFNRVDQILGFFLGLVRFILYAAVISTFLAFAESISFLERIPNWLFEDSTIAYWIYQRCLDLVGPLMRSLNAGNIFN